MTINEAIETYTRESAIASAAKKAADAAKKIILSHVGDADELTTDAWTVYVKRTTSIRLDTDALYSDFPDIKETYCKVSVSTSLDAHPVAGSAQKSA